jgi:uncharacterized protein
MTAHPIPLAALDDRLGFVGTAGSGKTYNAGTGVERIVASGGRVIIPDPLGVWWGLGLCADGQRPAPWREKARLVIFGGEHGDLPLNEHAGALIGETVAGMAESAILDLSGFGTKAAEIRFMLAFLTALYRHASNEPVHLILDEADMWAPQQEREKGEGPKLLGMMETIVRRGRVKGFIPWLISQRPAVLNKNVLSQVDGLVAFKLTSSQDRAALGAWIEGQADREQGKAILGSLPTLPTGTGVVWLPNREVLATAAFPPKITFDSSRTPKRGERVVRKELKPLDLDKLKGKLASIEEEVKANDPRALKAEVARLSRELVVAQKGAAPAWPDQREECASAHVRAADLEAAIDQMNDRLNAVWSRFCVPISEMQDAQNECFAIRNRLLPTHPQRRAAPAPVPVQRQPVPAREPRQSEGNGAVPHGCAKPLAALAGAYPAGMTEAQWATAAGYKRTGGTWGTYKSRLRGAGLIESRDGKWFATDAGAHAVGDVEMPPAPGPDLVRWWAAKLPGTGKMAEALIEAWPNGLSKDDLAERIGMAASGGSFGTYLSRLASPDLITRDGEVRLADEVMGG